MTTATKSDVGLIKHLLRRASFGATPVELDHYEALGYEAAIEELLHPGGRDIPMDLTPAGAGRTAFIQREPIGPVVAISAFNHPLNLIVHQVAPAVAVGCPVIVKPAGDTPLSALAFVNGGGRGLSRHCQTGG